MTSLDRLAALTDPVRRALYDHVARSDSPVRRDEAAEALGISRSLAAYHLDRLADDGFLQVTYRRPPGRNGPGAGRPAKLYERAPDEVSVHIPARDYLLVADVLARGIEAAGEQAKAAVEEAARATGEHVAGGDRRRPAAKRAIVEALERQGYEPFDDGGDIRMRNCPFHRLADAHRELVCTANRALLDGLLAGLKASAYEAALDPRPGECCVVVRRRV